MIPLQCITRVTIIKKIPRKISETFDTLHLFTNVTRSFYNMVITEAKIRIIIKEEIKKVLKEAVDERTVSLIKAMNTIASKYDSKSIGQTVPQYKVDANLFNIKDFINENVQDIDSYLEELKQIMEEQGVELDYRTDDYSDEYLTDLNFY